MVSKQSREEQRRERPREKPEGYKPRLTFWKATGSMTSMNMENGAGHGEASKA